MAKWRFSIIVPIYNVEMYLEKCIQSLVNQDFDSFEILLVDDGSTDGSGRLCDAFAEKYSSIRVFHIENQGVASARNYGIDYAEGEYLLFVDSDDYVEYNYCTEIDKAIRTAEDVDVVTFGGFEECQGKVKCLRDFSEEKQLMQSGYNYLLECYKNNRLYVQVWMYSYRKKYVDRLQLRFVEGILHEDVEFTPRALLGAEKIMTIGVYLYHYRIRENSISTQKNKIKNIKDLFWVLEQQSILADQQGGQLKKWMLNAVLNSYLNMIMEARMYRLEYRKFLKKDFMWGKAATWRNRFRVALCMISIRGYCWINDLYKNQKLRSCLKGFYDEYNK